MPFGSSGIVRPMRPLSRRSPGNLRASQTPPPSHPPADKRQDPPRPPAPNQKPSPLREKIAQGDTFAWLLAALQLLAPVLAVLIIVILLAYLFLYFLFLR